MPNADSNFTLLPEIQSWIASVEKASNASCQDTFTVEGLTLNLQAEHTAQLDWIRANLAPLSLNDKAPEITNWTLRMSTNPLAPRNLFSIVQQYNLAPERVAIKTKAIWRLAINSDLDICCRPSQGILWVIDRRRKLVHLITSARTKYPLAIGNSTARAIIIAYLHDQGWQTFHAGAVNFDGAAHLVVGDGGQGKTSLILALMSGGASMIANERILLKLSNGSIRCQPFPMLTAIGLGTATQYPQLENFIPHSEQLTSPTYRFSPRRVMRIDPVEWPKMSDKIQLLAEELDACFPLGKCHPGGHLNGVILPNIGPSNKEHHVTIPSDRKVFETLTRNVLPPHRDKHYPDWLPLGMKECDESGARPIVEGLMQKPAAEVSFFAGDSTGHLLEKVMARLNS